MYDQHKPTSFKSEIASSERRKNVMVMGDILEDVKMVKEQHHNTVLKVGFLNDTEKSAAMTEDYLRTFDIVIVGDGSLCPINNLLKSTFEDHHKLTKFN